MPTSPISNPAPPDVQHFALLLDEKYPGYLTGTNESLSDAYIRYMRQHPSADAGLVYYTVVGQLNKVAKLPGELGGAITKTTTILGKVGPATGTGLAKAAQNIDVLNGLNLGALFLRAGELLLGLVLIGVAVAHLTGSDNMISRTAKTVGKAAMF